MTRAAFVSPDPLTAQQRALVLQIALDHGVVGTTAAAFVIESKSLEDLAAIGLVGHIVATSHTPGLRQLGEAAPGPWLVEAVGALASEDVLVCSDDSAWNGKPLGEGGFSLLGSKTSIMVEATSVETGEPSEVGRFHDVITISGRSAPIASVFAKSKLVKQLETKLGLRIRCSSYES